MPSSTAPTGSFAIFGKHPSAVDHTAGLGFGTTSLVEFRRRFYAEALAGCISRSVWKDLPDSGAVAYDHYVLTLSNTGWIAAHFCQSSDASGRGQYPLVVCCDVADHELLRAGDAVWDWLDVQMTRARHSRQLDEVHAEGQQSLLRQLAKWRALPPAAWERSAWVDRIEGEHLKRLTRVIHALSPEGADARRVRIPLPENGGASIALWGSLLHFFLPADFISLMWRKGAAQADAGLSPPTLELLKCLFAPPEKVERAPEVPASAAHFHSWVRSELREWLADDALFPDRLSGGGNFLTRLIRRFGQAQN